MGTRSSVKLTVRTVATAEPGTIVWDAEVKGFGPVRNRFTSSFGIEGSLAMSRVTLLA